MIRLIVCGACGRMGSKIIELADRNPLFHVSGAIESQNHPSIGKKLLDGKVLISSDLASLKNSADALIVFTTPHATLSHLQIARHWKGISAVIGTTGFSPAELNLIKKFARKIPILLSPNMSIGMNLMFQLVPAIARKLSNYDIEIIESHHNQKKDAPSGSAMALAKEIASELKLNLNQDVVYGRKGIAKRNSKEIGIHAIRAGDIVGDHTVLFAGQGERLEVVHRASSRDAFASGALRAAQWIHKKRPALYSMKDVLC